MSKPIIPMHSPVLQRAAVTHCGVFTCSPPKGAEHHSLQRMRHPPHSASPRVHAGSELGYECLELGLLGDDGSDEGRAGHLGESGGERLRHEFARRSG
jgi:hypothetical protein